MERYSDSRIRYVRNKENLGFSGNFTQCFRQAQGKYIKFLNDDDILHQDCVRRMTEAIREHANEVTLVSSKRRIIDASGRPMKDARFTLPLSVVDALIKGQDMGDLLLQHSLNFIGEPSTVLFCKSALDWNNSNLFEMGDNEYICLADVSLWLRLLSSWEGSLPR